MQRRLLFIGVLALGVTGLGVAGCSPSREPGANPKTGFDGKTDQSLEQTKKSDSSNAVSPEQQPKATTVGLAKPAAKPVDNDRRTAAEQEFDRLLALADASLAAGRLDEAQGLYEKCRQIRNDAKVAQKLAAIGLVNQARDAISAAQTAPNQPKRLCEQAVKLEAAVTSFSKIDAETKHSFASISRELQTDTQWLFGQIVDYCEQLRKQCADAAASAYNKNELLKAQKQISRLIEALQNAQRHHEHLLTQSPHIATAKSGELKEIVNDVARLTDLQRKLELVMPAYQLLRKANSEARFSAADRERLTDTTLTIDKALATFLDARKQLPAADRPWIEGEIKKAEEQRDDLRVLMVLFGFEELDKPIRIDRGAFATAPAEWPQEFDLQLNFAAVTGNGTIKNSFLEHGDKVHPLRLTSGKALTLSIRSLEIQLISNSPVGEDIVLRFGSEQHPTGHLPNLSVARIAKYKPSPKAEYEFSTNITTNVGIDMTKPLPQKPIQLRVRASKEKDAKAGALRIFFENKPLNHRPTKENPKGQPFEMLVTDDFCQVRLALQDAPGLLPVIYQLRVESSRPTETNKKDQ